jgi:hypothetical protein
LAIDALTSIDSEQFVTIVERGEPVEVSLTDTQYAQLKSALAQFARFDLDRGTPPTGIDDALDLQYRRKDPERSNASLFEVRAGDVVGVVAVDGLVIAIQPKIPLSHFLHIISYGIWHDLFGLESDIQLAAKDAEFIEVIALWFLDQVTRLIPDRLVREYSQVEEFSTVVRGPVDPSPTTMKFLTGELLVRNKFDLFEVDSPPNRLLKRAILVTSQIASLPEEIRRRAAALHLALDEIGPYSPEDFFGAVDRRYLDNGFMPAIELARRLVAGAGLRSSRSTESARPFLLETPDLIEEGLREMIRRGLDERFRVDKKPIYYPRSNNYAEPDLRFTDAQTSSTIATGDVKYKWASSWKDHRSDLYQAAFFATAANTQRGSAIYFSDGDLAPEDGQRPGGLVLTQFFWNCKLTANPRESQSQLISQINLWLSPEHVAS